MREGEREREKEREKCYIFLCRTKKVSIPGILFPQIVGKNSCNLAAIRQATSTQIDIDRHGKQSSNRTITVRYTSIIHVLTHAIDTRKVMIYKHNAFNMHVCW